MRKLLCALFVVGISTSAQAQFVSVVNPIPGNRAWLATDEADYTRWNLVRDMSTGINTWFKRDVGTPEGNVTAAVGALYLRTDGAACTSVYAKVTGSGNTGWLALCDGDVSATETQTLTGKTLTGPDGTVTAPVFSFSSDTNTGFYRIGTDNIGLTTNGVLRWDVDATRILAALQVRAASIALTAGTTTIADSGGAGTATATITPTASTVKITCSDADGCDVTMGEGSITDGMIVRLINVSANVVNFADTSGVTELAGAFAAGQWDTLELEYVTDRWVEISRSNN